jgi:hypothetical protein
MFYDKKYPVNIKDGVTWFYPANSLSLGDNILWTAIFQDYLSHNSREAVSFLPFNADILQLVQAEDVDKVFIRMPSCVTDAMINTLREYTDVYLYELHVECHELWNQGVYPKFEVQSAAGIMQTKSDLQHWAWDVDKDYVVFHIRNIRTIKAKNTDPKFVAAIMKHLGEDYYGEYYVVLLGNDDSYGREIEYLAADRIVDLRNRLALDDIFKIIEKSRLFIGSDSGIAHLAGCCDVPMVCWNFVNEFWFPKVRNLDRCLFLTKEESRLEVVLREVKGKLKVHKVR